MLRRILARHPAAKSALKVMLRPFRRSSSQGYRKLEASERVRAGTELKSAWQNDDIPRQQRAHVDRELASYRAGGSVPAFDMFAAVLRPLAEARPGQSLLEIGCSSGYYSEVLAIDGLDLRYTGCDYSEAFVRMARDRYPDGGFDVADATSLPYADGAFDIAVSGCCLLHITDWQAAIAETARVARRYAMFHRTPVVHTLPTQFFTKQAYGVKTVEIHFGESELVAAFVSNGLRVIAIATLDADWRQGDAFATKTYLCEKMIHVSPA